MVDLFMNFNISQIILCSIGILLAIKGGWDLFDFFKKKYLEKFNKDYSQRKDSEKLNNYYKSCDERHQDT